MPYFDEASLRHLAEGVGAVPDKAQRLTEALCAREYVSESAKVYAHHGVCRRLSIVARCIEQIYRRLPPERDEVPPREALLDTLLKIAGRVQYFFDASHAKAENVVSLAKKWEPLRAPAHVIALRYLSW